jgi:RNA polymerase sigma-70 factor (ECF subfamily)
MGEAIGDSSRNTIGLTELLDESTYKKLLERAAVILRRESSAHLFEPPDLVHEAILRIARSRFPVRFQSTAHVIALVTVVMKRIMIDHARAHKLSGRPLWTSIDPEAAFISESPGDTLPLHDALARLANCEERLFRIVEMRFFGGFGMQEIASRLEISDRTVKRAWTTAREWLQATLAQRQTKTQTANPMNKCFQGKRNPGDSDRTYTMVPHAAVDTPEARCRLGQQERLPTHVD